MQQSRVPFVRSIRSKLFGVVALFLSATVALVSWQNGRMFNRFLERQIEDSVTVQAREAATAVAALIDNWAGNVAIGMHATSGVGDEARRGALASIVGANREFVAFQVIRREADGKTLGEDFAFTAAADARFETTEPSAVAKSIRERGLRWVEELEADPQDGDATVSLTGLMETGLPLMAIAIPFAPAQKAGVWWTVLTVWLTPVLDLLPNSDLVSATLIDRANRVFATRELSRMVARESMADHPLAQAAPAGARGFRAWLDKDGGERVGAFARLSRLGMTLIVERRAEDAYVAVSRLVVRASLSAWLLVMLAVPLAGLAAAGVTRQLRRVTEATEQIAAGKFDLKLDERGRDEVSVLSRSVNHMAGRLRDLLAKEAEAARREKELETAKIVQRTFFPPKPEIQRGALTVYGHFVPASECGGDWWGHEPGKDGSDVIFIGDAVGHGAPAALMTAMAYSACRTMADLLREEVGRGAYVDPARILGRLNRVLYEAGSGQNTMTFFIAALDLKRGVMTYANAAHPFPFLIPMTIPDERGRSGRHKSLTLRAPGVPLGYELDAKFKNLEMPLKPGDRLFLCTDGLLECASPAGEQWSKRRLVDALDRNAGEHADMICQNVAREAFTHFGSAPLSDDVTVVVLEIDRDWQRSSPDVETAA